ncbi:unnamed protein product [Rotaria socialis]|uniref:Uncharacterized protein n=1 Tax=Rotaria socialis TaxID=392032 RepID=A0A817XXW6_9BILA|nr:unnamed protein product [Rotaria socialis]CAF4105745.1 unnamed protein product [Rotaria socialis]
MSDVGLSSTFNLTWPKYINENMYETSTNHSDNEISSDRKLSKNLWVINQFTIAQRTVFILSFIILFWILFISIYALSRVIIRLFSNLKRFHFHHDLTSISSDKISRAFVISSTQYGSFRPTHLSSSLLYRSDSLFSNSDFIFNNEQTTSQKSLNRISQSNENNSKLLEYYLNSYNPLKIDLKDKKQDIVTVSTIKDELHEKAPSDTDTCPIANCYSLIGTSKRKIHYGRQYSRLNEPENCSATMSIADDRLSECSTKLTTITLPTLMITDCSNSQRLHTDIIELDEDEKEKN